MERTFGWTGAPGPGVLRLPDQPLRAGIVTLHGAADGRARQPLFDHLARLLSPFGVALLSYDRRSPEPAGQTSLAVQAEDAVLAMHAMSARLRCPVGIFGFSQGAWAASVAAAARLQAAATQPWFSYAQLPTTVPTGNSTWSDMDFDPAPTFDQLRCPVLALWGSDEECVPLRASIDAWHASAATVTAAELPNCGHWPVVGSGDPTYSQQHEDQLSADLGVALTEWLDDHLDLDDAVDTER